MRKINKKNDYSTKKLRTRSVWLPVATARDTPVGPVACFEPCMHASWIDRPLLFSPSLAEPERDETARCGWGRSRRRDVTTA